MEKLVATTATTQEETVFLHDSLAPISCSRQEAVSAPDNCRTPRSDMSRKVRREASLKQDEISAIKTIAGNLIVRRNDGKNFWADTDVALRRA